jgi:hypothetical protein
MFSAIESDDAKTLQYMLAKGVAPTEVNDKGYTPLHTAAFVGTNAIFIINTTVVFVNLTENSTKIR